MTLQALGNVVVELYCTLFVAVNACRRGKRQSLAAVGE